MNDLIGTLRAFMQQTVGEAQPRLATVGIGGDANDENFVTVDVDSITSQEASRSIPASGGIDYQPGDKVYVVKTPTGGYYPLAFAAGSGGGLYPRWKADYLRAPGGTMELSAGANLLTLSDTPSITFGGDTYAFSDFVAPTAATIPYTPVDEANWPAAVPDLVSEGLDYASIRLLSLEDYAALLPGRDGGQVLYGGTESGDDLALNSTSNGTKGDVTLAGGLLQLSEVNTLAGLGGAPVAAQKLSIFTGADATKGLIIKANSATQSANLQEWHTSAGGVIGGLTPSGHAGFGTAPLATQVLKVLRTFADNSDVYYGGQINPIKSVAGDQSFYGLDMNPRISAASGTQALMYGILGRCSLTGAATLTTGHGLFVRVDNTSTGTFTNAQALTVGTNVNSGGGVVTNCYGIRVQDQNVGGTLNFALQTNAGNVVINEGGDASTDFRVEGDSATQLIFADASADTVYFGGTTTRLAVDKNGDTWWEGDGSGIPYGAMYATNISYTVTIGAANTPTEVDGGFTVSNLNGVTFPDDHYLQVAKAGFYLIVWSLSINATTLGDDIEGGIMVNGSAVNPGTGHTHVGAGDATATVAATAILDLAANDQVSLYVANHDNADDIEVEHGSMTLVMVGGT